MQKKKTSVVILIFLVFSLSLNVFAAGPLDMEKTGSISVNMKYQGQAVPGGSLTLYHIAAPVWKNDGYCFEFTQQFEGCTLSLEQLNTQEVSRDYTQYVIDHSISGKEKTINSQGEVVFEDLVLGLYLLVQEEAAEGYFAASPFLVSVPMNHGEEWIYDVDASPKVDIEREPTTPTAPEPPGTPQIPPTGQLKWPIPVLAVSGLLLFAIGWSFCAGKKKKKDET